MTGCRCAKAPYGESDWTLPSRLCPVHGKVQSPPKPYGHTPKKVTPPKSAPPRYDAIFAEGTARLNAEAEGINPQQTFPQGETIHNTSEIEGLRGEFKKDLQALKEQVFYAINNLKHAHHKK